MVPGIRTTVYRTALLRAMEPHTGKVSAALLLGGSSMGEDPAVAPGPAASAEQLRAACSPASRTSLGPSPPGPRTRNVDPDETPDRPLKRMQYRPSLLGGPSPAPGSTSPPFATPAIRDVSISSGGVTEGRRPGIMTAARRIASCAPRRRRTGPGSGW